MVKKIDNNNLKDRKIKSKKLSFSKDNLKQMYYKMLLIRRFEERAGQLYSEGLIGGFCHLYIGQEAIVVGAQSVMRKQDTSVTAYREHGNILACGVDPKFVLAELLGKESGVSKGKGGSMHLFDTEKGFYGGHGIVGAQVPLGTGLAFAHAYKKDGGVTLTYMGDGAANQGQVYESFNMAALWKLPVVYIIENNYYGMGTHINRSSVGEFYKRGQGYNIPGVVVDGMNVLEIAQVFSDAIDFVANGNGPYLIEAKTYRYKGHSMSDPGLYRSKQELDNMKSKNDCIINFKKVMLENKITEDEIMQIDKKVKQQIIEVIDFAKNSPLPSEDLIYKDILC